MVAASMAGPVDADAERAADGGDILFQPLGDLVDGDPVGRVGMRDRHGLDEFTRLAVLLAVFDEEGFERHGAPFRIPAQGERCPERDQRRRRVADRRAVGDIAADGAHVAHLLAADAVPQFGECGKMPGDNGQRLGIAHARAERDAVLIHRDAAQLVEMADMDDGRDVAHELRHPEPYVGGAGDDGGLRLGGVEGGEIVERAGQDDPSAIAFHHDATAVFQRFQLLHDRRALGDQRVAVALAERGDRLGGADDRGIARAATEIALQRLLDLGDGRLRPFHPQAVERHDEARCAEAALRAVMIDHRLLHRMQRPARCGQRLHGHDVTAVERGDEADAGIDRFVFQPAIQ